MTTSSTLTNCNTLCDMYECNFLRIAVVMYTTKNLQYPYTSIPTYCIHCECMCIHTYNYYMCNFKFTFIFPVTASVMLNYSVNLYHWYMYCWFLAESTAGREPTLPEVHGAAQQYKTEQHHWWSQPVHQGSGDHCNHACSASTLQLMQKHSLVLAYQLVNGLFKNYKSLQSGMHLNIFCANLCNNFPAELKVNSLMCVHTQGMYRCYIYIVMYFSVLFWKRRSK